MRQFVFCAVAAAISLLASFSLSTSTGWAQAPNPRTEVKKGLVSVLTDGIADPGSRATQAINQLAAYAGRMPNVRVLPISGRGAAENVRDLLYLRGVDLAVVNSDVLAFLFPTAGKDDFGPGFGKGQRRRFADTGGASGNERYFVGI